MAYISVALAEMSLFPLPSMSVYKPNNFFSHVEKVSWDAKNMDACTEKKERRGEEGIKDQSSYRNQYVFLSIKIF